MLDVRCEKKKCEQFIHLFFKYGPCFNIIDTILCRGVMKIVAKDHTIDEENFKIKMKFDFYVVPRGKIS